MRELPFDIYTLRCPNRRADLPLEAFPSIIFIPELW